MDLKLIAYLVYLAVSGVLTVWVARTLFRYGQVFLDDALGNELLARSVNRLLLVGFYLLNLGYIALALKTDRVLDSGTAAIELLAFKLGLVLLVLGAIHLFNVYILSRYRRRRILERSGPPIQPTGRLVAQAPPPEQPMSARSTPR